MNAFLLWTPGLTSGAWAPDNIGPGSLPGFGTARVGCGYGSGYYFAGDGHEPVSVRDPATNHGAYPAQVGAGWAQAQSRFRYSRDFAVSPDLSSNEDVLLRLAVDSEDPNDAGFRPDEIFIACFCD
jgi:hypothetical protein